MADPRCRKKFLNLSFSWKLVYRGFWGRWLRIHHEIYWFGMADPIWRTKFPKFLWFKINSVLIKIRLRGESDHTIWISLEWVYWGWKIQIHSSNEKNIHIANLNRFYWYIYCTDYHWLYAVADHWHTVFADTHKKKTSRLKRQKQSHNAANIEFEECESGGFHALFIPEPNDSGDSGSDSESEDSPNSVDEIQDNPNSMMYFQKHPIIES